MMTISTYWFGKLSIYILTNEKNQDGESCLIITYNTQRVWIHVEFKSTN